MTQLNNGMMRCQVIEKHTMTVYEFYFEEGLLQRIHCYGYYTKEIKFDHVYNKVQKKFENYGFLKEDFEEAMKVFCDYAKKEGIVEFIEQLKNDEELKDIAKEVIRASSRDAAERAHHLARAVWELERK